MKVASAQHDGSAPSVFLGYLKAQAVLTHSRARPGHLGGSPWPPQLASAFSQDDDSSLPTARHLGTFDSAVEAAVAVAAAKASIAMEHEAAAAAGRGGEDEGEEEVEEPGEVRSRRDLGAISLASSRAVLLSLAAFSSARLLR